MSLLLGKVERLDDAQDDRRSEALLAGKSGGDGSCALVAQFIIQLPAERAQIRLIDDVWVVKINSCTPPD